MAWQYPDGAVLTRDDADEPGVLTLRYGDVELRVVRAGINDGYTPEVIWRDGREIARIERAHRLESAATRPGRRREVRRTRPLPDGNRHVGRDRPPGGRRKRHVRRYLGADGHRPRRA